jgi:hypothetical protein
LRFHAAAFFRRFSGGKPLTGNAMRFIVPSRRLKVAALTNNGSRPNLFQNPVGAQISFAMEQDSEKTVKLN